MNSACKVHRQTVGYMFRQYSLLMNHPVFGETDNTQNRVAIYPFLNNYVVYICL